jgi:hypothetical protein
MLGWRGGADVHGLVAVHMIDLGGDTTGNGVSKLVFIILSTVAETVRDRTRERIAEMSVTSDSEGRYLSGKPPFGWKVVRPADRNPRASHWQDVQAQGFGPRAPGHRRRMSGRGGDQSPGIGSPCRLNRRRRGDVRRNAVQRRSPRPHPIAGAGGGGAGGA